MQILAFMQTILNKMRYPTDYNWDKEGPDETDFQDTRKVRESHH